MCGRSPKATVQSEPWALLPVTRLADISSHSKHLKIREDVQNSGKRHMFCTGKRPSGTGPEFRTGGFWWVWADATELLLESWRRSNKRIGCRVSCSADRWWPTTGLDVWPIRLWAMAGLARSWSSDALLHLSYESILTFSDREVGEVEVTPKLGQSRKSRLCRSRATLKLTADCLMKP